MMTNDPSASLLALYTKECEKLQCGENYLPNRNSYKPHVIYSVHFRPPNELKLFMTFQSSFKKRGLTWGDKILDHASPEHRDGFSSQELPQPRSVRPLF
jgi:hypothetical protein